MSLVWETKNVSVSSIASPAELSQQEECQTGRAHAHDTLAAGLVFMMLANVGQRAIGFFRNLSFCRFLDDGSLGLWGLTSSFLLLAAPLAVLGLPGTFGKLVESFRVRGQLTIFLRRVASVCSISVAIVVALLLLQHESAGSWILGAPTSLATMVGVVAALCAVILFNTSTELLNGLRRGRVVSKMHTVNSLSFTLLSVVGLFLYPDWRVIIVAFALSSLIGILPGISSLSFALKDESQSTTIPDRSSFWMRVLPFAASIWVMNLLANLFDIVDRYMILYLAESHEIGTAMVGQFHSARILPLLLTSLTLMLSSLLLPYLAADWERGDRVKVGKSIQLTMKLVSYLFFILSITSITIAPFLFHTLLEGKYDDGLSILPLALTHCSIMATAILLQNYFWCIEKGKVVGVILFLGLLVSVALNYAWVPQFGISGAMASTAVAGGVILLATIYTLCRHQVSLDPASYFLCCLPITLLCGPIVAIAFATVAVVVASRTKFLLTSEEKSLIDNAILPQLSRFKIEIPSIWHRM